MNGDTICLGVGVRGGRMGQACDARASLNPAVPLHHAHGLQSGDNLEHRVAVRAIVKPYVTRRKFDFENNIGEVQAKRRCAPPSVSQMTYSTDDFLRFAG